MITNMNNTLGKKRERSVNFIPAETARLIDLVSLRRYIIENKKSDGETWKRKERAWKAIEIEFNRSNIGGTYRMAKHLKIKYEALKRDTRRKTKFVKTKPLDAVEGVEGGMRNTFALTSVEAKVKNMILPFIEGNETIYDSDHQFKNDTSGVVIIGQHSDDELLLKKECIIEDESISEPDVSKSDIEQIEPENNWTNWKTKPSSSFPSKHPAAASSRPKENELFDSGEENVIFNLQKKVLEEELQERLLKKVLLDKEIEHKTEMYQLEKEEMRLKVELLKLELAKHFKTDV